MDRPVRDLGVTARGCATARYSRRPAEHGRGVSAHWMLASGSCRPSGVC